MTETQELQQKSHAPKTPNLSDEDKPGYRKTKLGWIPEEWSVMRLEDLCSHFKSGFGITSNEIASNGQVPVYGGNGLRGYTKSTTHNGEFVLIGRQGALCGNIQYVSGKLYISEHAIAMQVNNQNHLLFWRYKLDFMNLNRLSESSAQPGLSVAKLSRLKTIVPPLLEQLSIARILSTWDKAIDTLQKLIAKKQERKKGLMQQLLSGKMRFEGFDGEWKEVRICEIGKVITGSTPSRNDEKYWGGEFPWASAQDFKGMYISNTIEKLTEEGKQKVRVLPKGAVLVTCIASIGLNAIAGCEMATNQQINAVIPYKGYSSELFYYLINYYRQKLVDWAGTTAVPILNKSSFMKVPILYPSNLEEQQKIASVLSAADREIEKLQGQLKKLQEQKKGLMQKLLTGEVRTTKLI